MFNARVWRGLWRTAATIGIAGAAIGASATLAGATPTPTVKAATWLKGQLVGGTHYNTTSTTSTPSPGLTADGLFAFAAASGFSGSVTTAATWLDSATHIGGYIGASHNYPGGLAKVALGAAVAKAAGLSFTPTSFAGTNLVTDLEGTQVTSGVKKGDFADPRDTPTYFGYANPTSQALAVIVLEKVAPSYSKLATAVAYLEGQVCTTGNGGGFHGYPSLYGGCATNTIGGDADTTGTVSQALSYYAAATGNATAKTAAENANGWLDHEKAAAGSTKVTWRNFCQTPFTSLTPSANSTALAIEGLVDDPRGSSHFSTDITKGKNWLVAAQNATASSATYGSLPACTATGPGSVRATTQGTQGLAGLSWVDLL
jgi:hypothetical protein